MNKLKNEGNDLFKEKKYNEAILKYREITDHLVPLLSDK